MKAANKQAGRVGKIIEAGKQHASLLTVPQWACDYASRLSVHELKIADSIAYRSIYAFFAHWMRPLLWLVLFVAALSTVSFTSVRGMIITLNDSVYIPVTDDGVIVEFTDLTKAVPEITIKGFMEKCLEGMYSLNTISYAKTFKMYSNKCFGRSKQQQLVRSVVDSQIFDFVTNTSVGSSSRKSLSKAKMVAFDVTEIEPVGSIDTEKGYAQYAYEVRGVFTKFDFSTSVKQVAPATFQVIVRNVVSFAHPDGLSFVSARLKWGRPNQVESN